MKPSPEVLAALRQAHTIAVVGLSSNPARPSFGVARYLQSQGYRIVPVNPREQEVLGEQAYPSLEAIPAGLGPIEIVDVFRRSEYVPELAEQAVRMRASVFWLQEGVTHPQAEARARDAGLLVVADTCLLKFHGRYLRPTTENKAS
ncbi:MAG: CoA-binding protein [Terriglobales bacterium]